MRTETPAMWPECWRQMGSGLEGDDASLRVFGISTACGNPVRRGAFVGMCKCIRIQRGTV